MKSCGSTFFDHVNMIKLMRILEQEAEKEWRKKC